MMRREWSRNAGGWEMVRLVKNKGEDKGERES